MSVFWGTADKSPHVGYPPKVDYPIKTKLYQKPPVAFDILIISQREIITMMNKLFKLTLIILIINKFIYNNLGKYL